MQGVNKWTYLAQNPASLLVRVIFIVIMTEFGNTSLGQCGRGRFQRGLLAVGRPSLNVGSTVLWTVGPG